MSDDRLTKINLMCFAAREGRGTPDDARALLTTFCECVERRRISANDRMADRVLEYVREALQAYLSGWRHGEAQEIVTERDPNGDEVELRRLSRETVSSLEAAFGLVRKKGHPEADEHRQLQMASAVVRYYVLGDGKDAGLPHQEALAEVAQAFNCDTRTVSRAWRAHRVNAVMLFCQEHPTAGRTPAQQQRLQRALGKQNDLLLATLATITRFNVSDGGR